VPAGSLLAQGRVTPYQLDTSLLGRGTATEEEPVDQPDWLAGQFEGHRAHLRAVAYRMLGSPTEADDAVQEAWLRLSRADTSDVANLGGWLTTVVARVCLDMLRSRTSRREEPLGARLGEPDGVAGSAEGTDPEHEAVLADSVGLALLVVLETLAPAERVAFVLHDMFAVPYEEIGAMLDRSPSATKQLASRARRRVQGTATVPDTDLYRQREAVGAFFAASRNGDFDALLAMLDPDVVVRPDRTAAQAGSLDEVRGAAAVAATFARRRARGARLAMVNGIPAAVWAPGGTPRVVFSFTFVGGKITAIDTLADPEVLGRLDVAILAG